MDLFPKKEDAGLLIEKVLKDDGVLNEGDLLYVSSTVEKDFKLIKDKIDEFYYNKGFYITYCGYQNKASVLLTDGNSIMFNVYDQEVLYAINHNQRIIIYPTFTEAIHSKLVVIDDEMYKNLCQMIKSKDEQSLALACEIMSSANRTKDISVKNLIRLSYEFNDSLISGITKQKLYKISPHVAELFNFLEQEYYEEYKRYKPIDD